MASITAIAASRSLLVETRVCNYLAFRLMIFMDSFHAEPGLWKFSPVSACFLVMI